MSKPPAVSQSVGHQKLSDLRLGLSVAQPDVMYVQTKGRWDWWREAQILPALKNWKRWCYYESEVSAGRVAQCRRIHKMLDY